MISVTSYIKKGGCFIIKFSAHRMKQTLVLCRLILMLENENDEPAMKRRREFGKLCQCLKLLISLIKVS